MRGWMMPWPETTQALSRSSFGAFNGCVIAPISSQIESGVGFVSLSSVTMYFVPTSASALPAQTLSSDFLPQSIAARESTAPLLRSKPQKR